MGSSITYKNAMSATCGCTKTIICQRKLKPTDLLDLADLLVEATDHVVRGIWHLLDLHQTHERINLQ